MNKYKCQVIIGVGRQKDVALVVPFDI